jgi:type II secretory pathway pseudopilin PulG
VTNNRQTQSAFSLVEVVVALGIVAFAIVAILGLLPIGLTTAHSAQDDTRTPQIAQDILSSIASQAQMRYPNVTIKQPSTNFSYDIDLSRNITQKWMSADYDGSLTIVDPSSPTDVFKHPYQVKIFIAPNPSGFDAGYATQVTVQVVTPPSANPDQTPRPDQTVHNYVRIISKY